MNYLDRLSEYVDINKLQDMGYFTAPASAKHHLNVKGGLYQHSVNVYETSKKLNESLGFNLSDDDLFVCSMFHDLCKCVYYTENYLKNGSISESKPYNYTATMTGHGDLSVYLLTAHLDYKLTARQMEAIRWHMGKYDKSYDDLTEEVLKKDIITFMLVTIIQISDKLSSNIYERR